MILLLQRDNIMYDNIMYDSIMYDLKIQKQFIKWNMPVIRVFIIIEVRANIVFVPLFMG